MARAKSAVLSPADKKAVITDMKAKIAAAKTAHKETVATLKAANKQVTIGQKAAILAQKQVDAADKAVSKLVESLAAITAPEMFKTAAPVVA